MSDETKFPPLYFSDSSMNRVLSEKEIKIVIFKKTDTNKHVYDNFNEDFHLYLSKLPNNNVKHYVSDLYNKNQIYIGISTIKDDGVFVRVAYDKDKLVGIILDSADLEINIRDGHSSKIDDCIYSSYFGLMRAATILNKEKIRQDKDLHKLLSTYIYLMFMKSIGKTTVYNQKQKMFINIVCMYAYYKHFLKEKHAYIKKVIHDHFKTIKMLEVYEEFEPRMDDLERYNDIKDIPKMFIDTRALIENPNQIILSLLRTLKTSGFYCFTGPLDQLIGLVVTTKYPFSIFSKDCLVNEEIHNGVEEIMKKYVESIKFDTSSIQ
jgi:hypothetical protein